MKKRLISNLLAICLILAACGTSLPSNNIMPEEQQTQTGQELFMGENSVNLEQEFEREWIINQIEMPDPSDTLWDIIPEGSRIYNEVWGLAETTVYHFFDIGSYSDEKIQFEGYCVQILQAPYTEWKSQFVATDEWFEGDCCEPWVKRPVMNISEDGNLYILLQGEQDEYIGRWSVEDGATASKITNEWLTQHTFFDEAMSMTKWLAGEKTGYYFLYDMDYPNFNLNMLWMDSDYQLKRGLPDITEGFVSQIVSNSYSDKVYLCGNDMSALEIEKTDVGYISPSLSDSGFTIWEEGKKEPVFSTQETSMHWHDCHVVFCSETEGYLWNMYGAWLFSLTDMSIKQILDHDQIDGLYNDILFQYGICLDEDGAILNLSEGVDGKLHLWRLEEKVTNSNKKTIEYATTSASSFLKQAIVSFNKQSDKYEVVLRTLEEGESPDDFRLRIQAELAAGEGPDLLEGGAVIDVVAGAQKGYLSELTEYFEEYENVMLPSVWQNGKVNEQLYAIPYQCQIITMVADKSLVGNRTNWTMKEAMEYMEKSGSVDFAGMEDEALLFYDLGLRAQSNNGLVDWEQGKTYFDSRDAVTLLEFSKKYADHDSTYSNVYQRIADKEVMTYVLYLHSYPIIQATIAMYEDEEAYIGFPTEDGTSGHLMSVSAIAVNHASSNVKGAVEFVKYLLAEEMQAKLAESFAMARMDGFPVRSDALELVFEFLQDEDKFSTGPASIGNYEYEMVPLSDENIDALREVFMTARPIGTQSEALYDFVSEEIGSYISGEKSAQEVLDILQNRTQLYLDEN